MLKKKVLGNIFRTWGKLITIPTLKQKKYLKVTFQHISLKKNIYTDNISKYGATCNIMSQLSSILISFHNEELICWFFTRGDFIQKISYNYARNNSLNVNRLFCFQLVIKTYRLFHLTVSPSFNLIIIHPLKPVHIRILRRIRFKKNTRL